MRVIFYAFFTEDCKPSHSPFQSGVKLSVSCTSPEVDATLYRQLVGKLLYLTHTRPDLSFVVGLVARFMQNPRECPVSYTHLTLPTICSV